MLTAVLDDARTLWDFHQIRDEGRMTDVGIGLGSHDIGVAEHTAKLFHQGRFKLIVFTGANAPTTVTDFPRGEAVEFAERAEEMGVPRQAILVEPRATNTGQNLEFTRAMLEERGIPVTSATLISRPYQQRRAYATAQQVWPEIEIFCSARSLDFADYVATIGDEARVINMLVGDTQRLWAYADKGFAAPQEVDEGTMAAYERLVAAGYTTRLLDETA